MRSPYNLLQEIYPNEWKILVCCILLNQTTGIQVHQIIKNLFKKYPNPKQMAEATSEDIYEIIQSCGLGNKRSITFIRMSKEFLDKNWIEPKELFGLGEYANDSWLIFIKNKIIKSKDKELKKYIKWKIHQRRKHPDKFLKK